MIKIILLSVVFLSGSYIGIVICERYKLRHRYFNDCILLCNQLKNNIFLNKDKLHIVLNDASKSLHKLVVNDMQNGVNDVEIINSVLSTEEKEKLKKFYNTLGKNDIDGELNNINNFLGYLEQRAKLTENEIVCRGQFARKMSIFISLGLVIVLL